MLAWEEDIDEDKPRQETCDATRGDRVAVKGRNENTFAQTSEGGGKNLPVDSVGGATNAYEEAEQLEKATLTLRRKSLYRRARHLLYGPLDY